MATFERAFSKVYLFPFAKKDIGDWRFCIKFESEVSSGLLNHLVFQQADYLQHLSWQKEKDKLLKRLFQKLPYNAGLDFKFRIQLSSRSPAIEWHCTWRWIWIQSPFPSPSPVKFIVAFSPPNGTLDMLSLSCLITLTRCSIFQSSGFLLSTFPSHFEQFFTHI